MSRVPDWNTPGDVPAYQPPTVQAYPPAPSAAHVYPQAGMAPAAGYGMPGMQIPPGTYYDQLSGLVIPQGTTLAPVGRRIGAFFLGYLLAVITLGIGYTIWGAITWANGQTPAQAVLGLQTWKPQERVNASWGTMFLRGLGYVVMDVIPFAQLVSFFLFVSGREHRALHDSIASTVVLYDPGKVLRKAAGIFA